MMVFNNSQEDIKKWKKIKENRDRKILIWTKRQARTSPPKVVVRTDFLKLNVLILQLNILES